MNFNLNLTAQQQNISSTSQAANSNFSNISIASRFPATALGLNTQQQQQQQQQQQTQQSQQFNLQRNYAGLYSPGGLNSLALSNLQSSINAAAQAAASAQQTNCNSLLAMSLNNAIYPQNTSCSLNNTLFVGNLHASLQEMDLIQVFRPFGRIVECCKKWLHFGFVKFTTEEEACHAYVTLNGFRLKGRPMRLEFQNRTKKARIKAILAQAALQAASSVGYEEQLASLGLQSHLQQEDRQQLQQHHQQLQSQQHSQHQQHNLQQQQQQLLNSLKFNAAQKANFNMTGDSLKSKSCDKSEASISQTWSNQPSQLNGHQESTSSFFNQNHLIKFATEVDKENKQPSVLSKSEQNSYEAYNSNFFLDSQLGLGLPTSLISQKVTEGDFSNLIKKAVSPAHDTSDSCDSGCRSNSFGQDDCDSGVSHLQTLSVKVEHPIDKLFKLKACSSQSNMLDCPSEHLEFTCSTNSCSPLELAAEAKNGELFHDRLGLVDDHECDQSSSNSNDTADDASEIPSDCMNDMDLLDEEEDRQSVQDEDDEDERQVFQQLEKQTLQLQRQLYNQVMEKDGSIARRKLECGVYRSVNETLSLFVQPADILKQMESEEFDKYALFPSEMMTEAYVCLKNSQYVM